MGVGLASTGGPSTDPKSGRPPLRSYCCQELPKRRYLCFTCLTALHLLIYALNFSSAALLPGFISAWYCRGLRRLLNNLL